MHTTKHAEWRRPSSSGSDTMLTPPLLLKALGKFDMDPCCPEVMPWKTAKKMVCLPADGLNCKWSGRVWCNPPYSNPLPWIEKMSEHGNGVMLLSAKSFDTKWGQELLKTGDSFLFLAGRILFFTAAGEETKGKWLPNVLVAYGDENSAALKKIVNTEYAGVMMKRL